MRKFLLLSLVVLCVLGTLPLWAGAVVEKAPEGPTKIVYWRSLTGVAGDVQDELVAKFNQSQDKVIVEAQFQGAYAELLQKLFAALAAGEMPDLVLLDSPFVTLFAKDGALVSLDEFVKKDTSGFNLKDFIPGLMQDGYYAGSLYALPLMRSTPLLYVNGDMLAAAGLPRRAPKTWDEFREFCKKVTKFDQAGQPIQQGAGFTIGQTTAHWYFQGGVYSFGGQVSDENFGIHLNEEPAIKLATLWQDMVFKDKTAIPSNSHDDFLNKKVAMVFGSTGSMGNLLSRADFEVIPAFMPAQVKNQVPVGGAVIAMTSSDKRRQEATWEFMKFMTNAESNSQIVIKTGYMPISKASMVYPATVAYFDANPIRKVAIDQLIYTCPQASVISLGKGTEILRQMVEKLLIGNRDPKKVMEETTADLLKEYNESFK
ncbi:ABC transporter substrate-binding protein [Sphaerochaeta sp. PS]|uniref:ABC transporter substrate-binding protein n=1 Tax=Sphaerochaeta sp. PS TaxID=3076336 RepID=UPI0028A39A01|nr:ABC transporter substrate-binding protein [Sphaerochaeta sp. PS]MDT4761516.1 ABC transporter substrate-binding protein [Sphaerochaeta sp. PS]